MDNQSVIVSSNTDSWLATLARQAPSCVAVGLRAGAGFYARTARRLMTQRIQGAAEETVSGRFRGQRLTDAIYVHAGSPRDLMVTVYLNRNRDARADWLENGTDECETGRRARKRRLKAGHAIRQTSRGRIIGRRFFNDTVTRTETALRIMVDATLTAFEKEAGK